MPGKKGILTGGTGDVNPQWYKLRVEGTLFQNGAMLNAAYTGAQTFPLPIPRFAAGNGRAIVVEVLKTRWTNQIGYGWTLSTASGASRNLIGYLATRPPGVALGLNPAGVPYTANDPTIIDYDSTTLTIGTSATAFVTFAFDQENPVYHDLTDGDGHGVLVATDNITLAYYANLFPFDGAIYSMNPSVQCDILYRFKEVSLQEYIGIVQSQQGAATGTVA